MRSAEESDEPGVAARLASGDREEDNDGEADLNSMGGNPGCQEAVTSLPIVSGTDASGPIEDDVNPL